MVSEPRKHAASSLSYSNRYFSVSEWLNYGRFFDAAVSDNNPCLLALQEMQRIAPAPRLPDQFLSVGTGASSARQGVRTETAPSLLFGNSSLQQVYLHWYNKSFDGDKIFHSMRRTVAAAAPDAEDANRRFQRFNLPLADELPDLADVGAMDQLADAAWAHFASHPGLEDEVKGVLATTFYFKLKWLPRYDDGSFVCRGYILCRIPMTKPAFPAFLAKLDSMGAQFVVQTRSLRRVKSSIVSLDQTGNFSQPVFLRVGDLEEKLDVRLRFANSRDYHISASPIPISTLLRLQLQEENLSSEGAVKTNLGRRKRCDEPSSPATKRRRLVA